MDQAHEDARLDALYQLKLLDTPPSEAFDRVTRMASQIFGLPIAAVSLTDRDRQWFKSRVGVAHNSIERTKAPCAQVMSTASDLVIPDLLADPYYATSRLAGDGVRFYAGAPLITKEGHSLGALCVLGTEPRTASEQELASLRDLAAIVMAQIELQHAFGRIDPISGRPNRNQFLEDLADLARDRAGEQRMATLVDLARNEEINSIARVMGSARLDGLVREAARALALLLGPDRNVYHVAATQFAFLSPPDVDPNAYLEKLQRSFAQVRETSSMRFVTTVASGVMPFVFGEVQPRDVLRGAYSASQDARRLDGAIAVYSASADRAHQRQLQILDEFGKALHCGDQLHLVFQPRIDLASGRCVGAEALLRWRHPGLGDVSPGEFIPVVEHTGLVRAATDWVLRAAVAQLGAWRAAGFDLTLSLNVSAANLNEDDLVQRIQLLLLKHRLKPEALEVEVTESAVMTDGAHALACLHDLVDAGVHVAIDDFGAGYSSLAYLQKLPAHVVKIDQSFVRDLGTVEDGEVLIGAMVSLAQRLGYRVVAEGVESAAAASILRAMKCDEAQGFWLGRPMDATAFERWLKEHDADVCLSGVAA